MHPRGPDGGEDVRAVVVDDVVSMVRATCGVPVGVSTGAWIEPDVGRRVALVRSWRSPGLRLGQRLGSRGVRGHGSMPGRRHRRRVWTVGDAELLVSSQLSESVLRVLIEPVEVSESDAVAVVEAIHAVLDRHDLAVPRLQHGNGEATWVLLSDAIRRGIDTRVGLEDTFQEPDLAQTCSNASLVRAARQLGAGQA